MFKQRLWVRRVLFLVLFLFVFAGCVREESSSTQVVEPTKEQNKTKQDKKQKPLVVFLLRHAEKEKDKSRDPKLTNEGKQRAKQLAKMLRDSQLNQIHSTNFERTKATVEPAAKQLELKVQIYAAKDPKSFVSQLKQTGGRHLVVGHSNTVPELVKLLGGDPGSEIDETEYDRFYVVSVDATGKTTTILMRF